MRAFVSRFLAESRLAASIDHPGIVPIFEAGEGDGHLYIAMRFVDGGDLGALLRVRVGWRPSGRSRLSGSSPARWTPLTRAVLCTATSNRATRCSAGRRCGARLSRRLRPDQALRDSRGTPRATARRDARLPRPRADRRRPADGRADLYSLGCVLFECVTGEVAFPGDWEVAAITRTSREPPHAANVAPVSRAALDAVLMRALAKDPERRWQTGAELAAGARAALAGTRAVTRRVAYGTPPTRPGRAGLDRGLAAQRGAGADALNRTATPAAIDANAVAVIDPGRGSLAAQVLVGASPAQIAVGTGAVWVSNAAEGAVSRLDPKTRTVRQTIRVGSAPGAIAVGWAGSGSSTR